jgi:hypothetical protein
VLYFFNVSPALHALPRRVKGLPRLQAPRSWLPAHNHKSRHVCGPAMHEIQYSALHFIVSLSRCLPAGRKKQALYRRSQAEARQLMALPHQAFKMLCSPNSTASVLQIPRALPEESRVKPRPTRHQLTCGDPYYGRHNCSSSQPSESSKNGTSTTVSQLRTWEQVHSHTFHCHHKCYY